jgi:apolipoprotein N-acyltransferase
MKKEKTNPPYDFLPILSLSLLVISMFISIFLYDIRPIAMGITIFGMGYFGLFAYWLFLKRFYFPMLFALIGSILISMFGIGIFLNYYGIDVIFNFYKEIANFLVRVL